MRFAYIAEVPRLVLYVRDLLLALRIADNKSVFIAVFAEPLEVALVLEIVAFGLAEIKGVACFMLAETRLCNTGRILRTLVCKVSLIEFLLEIVSSVASEYDKRIVVILVVEVGYHFSHRLIDGTEDSVAVIHNVEIPACFVVHFHDADEVLVA